MFRVSSKTFVRAVGLAAAVALSLATGASSGTAGDPSTDKLAQILARGTLILSTDPGVSTAVVPREGREAARAYEVRRQSDDREPDGGLRRRYRKARGSAARASRRASSTPTWSEIISGHWNDRWDISYGSGAINSDRANRLYFTQPYYAAPQLFFVATKSKYQKPSDLNGKTIGVCAGCTHELYLKRTLTIPGVKVVYKVNHIKIAIFDVENPGLAAVADGKLDAFLCAAPEGDGSIHNGLKLRALKEPAFFMYPTGFVDRFSAFDVKAFVARIDQIVQGLHRDGSLVRLSKKDFFGVDYATKAGQFDMKTIGQVVK